MAKQAYDLGASFDAAFDRIRIQTGATGQALEGLQENFRNVAGSGPSSFEDVSIAVAGLNQRLHLTGPELEAVANQVLTLSRLTKTELNENIRLSARLFGDWSVATEDQARTLDKVFVASQQTGAGIQTLMQNVVFFGAPLRQLGFGLDEAIALFAKWENEGVNAETVAASLRIAIGRLAEAGVEPAQAFRDLITVIGGMKDPVAATDLAIEVFGARAGVDMVAAIREGRFALGDLVTDLGKAEGAIDDTRQATDDAAETMKTAFNRIGLGFEGVGTAAFAMAASVASAFAQALESAAAFISGMNAALSAGMSIQAAFAKTTAAPTGRPTSISNLPGGDRTSVEGPFGTMIPGPPVPHAGEVFSGGVWIPIHIANDRLEEAVRNTAEYHRRLNEVGQQEESAARDEAVADAAREAARAEAEVERIRQAIRDRNKAPAAPPRGGGGRGGGGGGAGRAEVVDLGAFAGFELALPTWVRDNSFEVAMGEKGGRAAAALTEAFSQNTERTGEKAVSALGDLIVAMQRAGIPQAEETADELKAHFAEALATRDPESLQAALEFIEGVGGALARAGDPAGQKAAKEMIDAFAKEFETQAKNELQARVNAALDEFQTNQQNAAINRRRDIEDRGIDQARGRDAATIARDRGREDAQTAEAQRREDESREEAHQRRLRDIRRRGGAGQGQAIAEENRQFREDTADLEKRRKQEDEDRSRRRKQQDADRAELIAQQDKDRIELRGQQNADRAYTKGQETELAVFKDKLEFGRATALEQIAKDAHQAALARYAELHNEDGTGVADTVFDSALKDAGAVESTWDRILAKMRDAGVSVGPEGAQHGVRDFEGGWITVGEAGPELLHLPRGSDVYPISAVPGVAVASPAAALAPIENHVHIEMAGREVAHIVIDALTGQVRTAAALGVVPN